MRLTEQVHQILRDTLQQGDFAIDATAGNGHDTVQLAQLIGPTGKVVAIDLQAEAIAATRRRLAGAGIETGFELIEANHAEYLEARIAKTAEQVAAIVFNLGYLPGSDKTVQTETSHTLRALDAAAQLLRPGGRLCVTAYRAHSGGESEAAAVEKWMGARKAAGWELTCQLPPSRYMPPVLWVAIKPGGVATKTPAAVNS
jgi:ubiquinone/menaquinone biosynthesis C-methylase UbiE